MTVFVGRKNGVIIGWTRYPAEGFAEEMDEANPELIFFNNPPPTPDQQRVNAIRLNTRRTALINAIITEDDAALIADINARYPGLPANAIKAIVDIFLIISPVIRS